MTDPVPAKSPAPPASSAAVPPPPPLAPEPPPKAALPAPKVDHAATTAKTGSATPKIDLPEPAPTRFLMGARSGVAKPWQEGPSFSMTSLWLGGLFPLAGSPQGAHTATLVEGSMGGGGNASRGGLGLDFGVSLRQSWTVAPNGTQLFVQGGGFANYFVLADDRFRQGSVSWFGLAARGQAGLAVPVGDIGWRVEVGPYAEVGTNRREMGLTLGFNGP